MCFILLLASLAACRENVVQSPTQTSLSTSEINTPIVVLPYTPTLTREPSGQITPSPLATTRNTPVPTKTIVYSPTPELTETPLSPSIPHYDFLVHLDYPNHYVQVEQTVNLANNSTDSWEEIVFNVSPAYWPNIFSLESLEIALDGVTWSTEPQWTSTMLHVSLPRPLDLDEAITINLAFSLSLPTLDPYGWGPAGNAGWAPDVTQMGDWYPALVPYQTGRGWHTWDYKPVGDPVRSILADYDITIHAPADITIAAPGIQSDNGDIKTYRLEQARAFSFLASDQYTRLEGNVGDIAISIYVTAGHQESGTIVLEEVGRAITLFTELFGPYPYPEFIIAENGFLTANEYSALVALSGFAFESYQGNAESLLVALTAHEVAHQWWYGVVGNDQVNEPWLDEAMAMFCELLYYERHYPESVDWWWFYRVDQWQPQGFVDISVHDFLDSKTYVHNMYGVAARFMSDLRNEMGADTFLTFIHDYYTRNINQIATGNNFFTTARSYLPATTLRTLTDTYFQQTPSALMEP